MLNTYRLRISKEVYDRAQANGGVITQEDKEALFDSSMLYGYGVYGARAIYADGEYLCEYSSGDSCD